MVGIVLVLRQRGSFVVFSVSVIELNSTSLAVLGVPLYGGYLRLWNCLR